MTGKIDPTVQMGNGQPEMPIYEVLVQVMCDGSVRLADSVNGHQQQTYTSHKAIRDIYLFLDRELLAHRVSEMMIQKQIELISDQRVMKEIKQQGIKIVK